MDGTTVEAMDEVMLSRHLVRHGVTLPNGQHVDLSHGSVDIPETILGKDGRQARITGIGYEAFEGCTNLERVTMPDSVTKIDYHAFAGCTSLTNATLSKAVIAIAAGAFRDCTSLTSIVLPPSLQAIGTAAFRNCSALLTIEVPPSVTHLGAFAFCDCPSLEQATMPTNLVNSYKASYLDAAFDSCPRLARVNWKSDFPAIATKPQISDAAVQYLRLYGTHKDQALNILLKETPERCIRMLVKSGHGDELVDSIKAKAREKAATRDEAHEQADTTTRDSAIAAPVAKRPQRDAR